MDNSGEHHALSDYILTVNELEKLTGIDFFVNLPDDVEESVENCVDKEAFNIR